MNFFKLWIKNLSMILFVQILQKIYWNFFYFHQSNFIKIFLKILNFFYSYLGNVNLDVITHKAVFIQFNFIVIQKEKKFYFCLLLIIKIDSISSNSFGYWSYQWTAVVTKCGTRVCLWSKVVFCSCVLLVN